MRHSCRVFRSGRKRARDAAAGAATRAPYHTLPRPRESRFQVVRLRRLPRLASPLGDGTVHATTYRRFEAQSGGAVTRHYPQRQSQVARVPTHRSQGEQLLEFFIRQIRVVALVGDDACANGRNELASSYAAPNAPSPT